MCTALGPPCPSAMKGRHFPEYAEPVLPRLRVACSQDLSSWVSSSPVQIIPCDALTYRTLPYRTVPYHIISYRLISNHVVPRIRNGRRFDWQRVEDVELARYIRFGLKEGDDNSRKSREWTPPPGREAESLGYPIFFDLLPPPLPYDSAKCP